MNDHYALETTVVQNPDLLHRFVHLGDLKYSGMLLFHCPCKLPRRYPKAYGILDARKCQPGDSSNFQRAESGSGIEGSNSLYRIVRGVLLRG
jgi:hypothetical protein